VAEAIPRYNQSMRPRIAIPVPHSFDPGWSARSLPQYERAVEQAGGEPVSIPLDAPPAQIMRLIERCDGVLLPGSKADVDPAKYGAPKHPKTEPGDRRRDTADELLLQDAYNMRKPVLGICYGLQILNVYRSGTLLQHIESGINHEAGKKVPVAHTAAIEPNSKLAGILASGAKAPASEESDIPRLKPGALASEGNLLIPVNSSHHQSAEVIGDGLRIAARCPDDGVIEALEGTAPDHFVLAVQWHPERSAEEDERSRAIFRALIEAAKARHKQLAGEFESV
jgi:putative glutamine amidotransferase